MAELEVLGEIQRWGETFKTVRPGTWALMEFAKVATSDVDSSDMQGLAAMHDLIESCIHPDEMSRFARTCKQARAGHEEILSIVQEVVAQTAQRPTSQPSDSSAGLPTTSASSAAAYSSPAVSLMEHKRRGDLALLHKQAEESRASA